MTPNKRSAPHVVFLIDVVQQYENGHDATVRWIQGMVLRILLYFLDSVDKRTTWGYRFFNSKTRSIAMTNQSFQPISTKTVHEFANEYSKRIKNEHDPNLKAVDAPFTVVTRSLVQALAEFHWSDIDLSSESPRRQWSQSAASRGMQKIDIKNYTYLMSPAPHSLEALQQYMPSYSTINNNQETDVNDQLAQWLQLMHSELRKWLWEDYANHRISLSWIDTGSFIGNSEELLLCKGLGSILRPFGGTHIKASMLMTHFGSNGISFSKVFHSCIPRTVNVGIDTISGKSTQELLGLNEEIPSWTVHIKQGSEQEHPSKVTIYSATSKTSRDMIIEQLDIVRFIHRCQLKMSWIEYPSSEEQDIFVLEATDNKCSSLIDDLRARRHLAIVHIIGNKESYAVIEPKVNNTAILRILSPTFQLSHVSDLDLTPPKKRTFFESTMLDYISLPATHAKKARLVDLLQDTSNGSLRLASLSTPKQQLLIDIKNRRRNRRGRLEAVVEAKLQSQSQPSTPPPIQAEPTSFELPTSAQELRDALRQIYLETIYTQKWLLIDSMKQMYECMEHVLEKTKGSTRLNEVTSAVRSLLYLSSEFDTKHNHAIVGNREEELPEDERSYFSEWRAYTMRTGNDDYASTWRKALKVREGKMQMVLYLLSICLERRSGRLSITQSQKELKGEVDLENPMLEYQLCIYYDRSGVWEQVYDIGTFLQELEQNEMGGPGFRIDPADTSLAIFFHHMHQSISKAAIDWTQFLVDRSVEEELPDTQSLSSQVTSSQMSTTSFWEPSSPPDMLSSQKSTKSKNLEDASSSQSKKKSAIPDLPFMRREVDLSKRKNIPERTSSSSAKPSMRRANSFTQPLTSSQPKRARFNASQEQDSVLVKLREPLSPTTPRTRFERDFGFSMSGLGFTPHRNETQSPSNRRQVAMVAEEQDDDDDDDDITEARTPRRVRRLMMTPTRMRHEATTPHRRPRRNLTESLMAASTSSETTKHFGQEEEDDLDGIFDVSNPMPVFGDILSDDDEDGGGGDGFLIK